MLRRQDIKINHNIMLGGKSRIGKDAAIRPVIKALGRNAHTVGDASKLNEPYQDWAYGHKLVVFNELMEEGIQHRQVENQLKQFGANPPEWLDLRLFGKGATVKQPNLLQIIAQSNYQDALNIASSPERWFCVWCPPKERREQAYYDRLYGWLEHEGGNAAVLHHLLHEVHLNGFNPSAPAPATSWNVSLVEASMDWDIVTPRVEEMLERNQAPFDKGFFKLEDVVDTIRGALFDPEDRKRVTRPRVIKALRHCGCVSSGEAGIRHNGRTVKLRLWATPEFSHLEGEPGRIWAEHPAVATTQNVAAR